MILPQRIDVSVYGYDAPGVVLGLLFGGGAGALAATFVAAAASGAWRALALVGLAAGLTFFGLGVAMLVYAFAGKLRTRDRIIALAALTGSERVLDVGTGAGLLAIAAAMRLPTGSVVGVDLWAAKDLSNNGPAAARRNALLEGVADRIEIITGDARSLPFPDQSFDRVVSLLCLHNIEPKADRLLACREIARVLKPGGRAVIADYVPTYGYGDALGRAGLTVETHAALGVALSLMWITTAAKPDGIAG